MTGRAARSADRTVRVVLGVLGLDQHEAGALSVAHLLREHGAEVIYLGRFNLPETLVSVAIQEDADIIGVSCHSWEFLYYAEELVGRASALDPPIPVVLGGSVVTESDRTAVLALGVDAALAPGASPAQIVSTVLGLAAR